MKFWMTVCLALVGWTSAAADIPAVPDLSGSWRGELKMGPASIPLIFNFTAAKEGGMLCTLDSPQQHAVGLPMAVECIPPDSVVLTSAALGATFRGRAASGEITGRFEQHGYVFPLTLRPVEPLLVRRPQTPRPPFPYRTVDTLFAAGDGTLLAGTLTVPGNPARNGMPMVVLVSGSGPQNRDEEIFEHRPFAVIADCLARRGVASFRYDDRGTAASQGNFDTSTTYTFKEDAAAALEFARGVGNVGSAGVLGHSEGGTIALMLAAEGLPDFVVSLAGMAVSGAETILDQNRRLMERMGLDRQEIDGSMKVIEAVFDEICAQARERRRERIDAEAVAARLGVSVLPMIMQSLQMNVDKRTDYFDTFLTIDPGGDLARVKCPVLALNGTLDRQVDAAKNLSAIRQGVKTAEIHELEGLNHLFQHAVSGETDEYDDIRETVAPEVLALIADFCIRQ